MADALRAPPWPICVRGWDVAWWQDDGDGGGAEMQPRGPGKCTSAAAPLLYGQGPSQVDCRPVWHGGSEVWPRVQVLNLLYHNYPGQRTLVVAHSNQALNDVFEKTIQRDVPARYLLRLGMGQEELATDVDFSRVGAPAASACRSL